MRFHEVSGYFASSLVILAFCMKDIVALRLLALTSNVAFLVYGIGSGLAPVWLLHAVLLPINGWRLCQALLSDRFAQHGLGESHR
jgi:CRP/FNR family cyclic AMP-dependent transcriptional regulator